MPVPPRRYELLVSDLGAGGISQYETLSFILDGPMSTPRLAVVSYLGNDPFTPRGTRTKALVEALGGDWTVEFHASSSLHAAPHSRTSVRYARKVIARARKRLLLDNQEIWSRSRFRTWEPKVDGALLIGWPMSPLVYASARLYARGIPYVVDVGDPWMLTHQNPYLRRPVASRATRAERRLWARAAGAVFTTAAQANAISSLYPDMPILVRPNGYETVEPAAVGDPADPRPRPRETISLVNFGNLSSVLLDVSGLLGRLVESGRWREIKFAQYGNDWDGVLDKSPSEVIVTRHKPVPWKEAVVVARDYDAAVVVGTRNAYRMQMPSKAASYLTLPIPRVAVTCGAEDDALSQYVADKAGWLCSAIDDPQLAEQLHDHLSRGWTAGELAPPVGESWPCVADEIAAFVKRMLSPED
jgi:hypothetical protein